MEPHQDEVLNLLKEWPLDHEQRELVAQAVLRLTRDDAKALALHLKEASRSVDECVVAINSLFETSVDAASRPVRKLVSLPGPAPQPQAADMVTHAPPKEDDSGPQKRATAKQPAKTRAKKAVARTIEGKGLKRQLRKTGSQSQKKSKARVTFSRNRWKQSTSSIHFDVMGIGMAFIDVIARTDDDFLVKHNLSKGALALLDERRAAAIYDAIGSAVKVSGGWVANTLVGVANLGGRAAFVGKVRDDELGRVFAQDIRAAGVAYDTPPALAGPSTGRCYVLVTPDGQRTIGTYLPAAPDLQPNDIDVDTIAASGIIFLEGYLWDAPHAKEAFRKAANIAHAAERWVALTLSDSFCVYRHRADFLDLIRAGTVDLVFANEHELDSLYETVDFDAAVEALRNDAHLAVVTRGEKGCLVVSREKVEVVPAVPVERVVEEKGAGDLFAAGFLVGLSLGEEYRECARLGALTAAEKISHFGGRPEISLEALAQENDFELYSASRPN